MSLPRVLVFDLDGCTWWPEMCKLTFIVVITAHVALLANLTKKQNI